MTDQKVNVIVGLVVLVALIILIFGINFLKNTIPGEKKNRYSVVFNRVSTLTEGDPVRLNGVTMGRVKVIELWQNKVRVHFDLKKTFKDANGEDQAITLPMDSRIRVQNIGLMGERQIEINLGKSQNVYKPGDIIQNGLFDAGIAEFMGTAGQVFTEAENLVLSVRGIIDSTVGREDFVIHFKEIMNDTKTLTGRLNDLLDDADPKIRTSMANLEKTSRELEHLLSSQKESITTIVQNGVAVSERAGGLVEQVESITSEVNSLLQKINTNEGTLGAMINDAGFYRDLRTTLRDADSLLSIIKKRGLDVNVDIF